MNLFFPRKFRAQMQISRFAFCSSAWATREFLDSEGNALSLRVCVWFFCYVINRQSSCTWRDFCCVWMEIDRSPSTDYTPLLVITRTWISTFSPHSYIEWLHFFFSCRLRCCCLYLLILLFSLFFFLCIFFAMIQLILQMKWYCLRARTTNNKLERVCIKLWRNRSVQFVRITWK